MKPAAHLVASTFEQYPGETASHSTATSWLSHHHFWVSTRSSELSSTMTECMCGPSPLPQCYAQALISSGMVSGHGAFRRLSGLDIRWGHEGRVPVTGSVFLTRGWGYPHAFSLPPPLPCEHDTARRWWSINQNGGPQGECCQVGPLTSDFWPLELWGINRLKAT